MSIFFDFLASEDLGGISVNKTQTEVSDSTGDLYGTVLAQKLLRSCRKYATSPHPCSIWMEIIARLEGRKSKNHRRSLTSKKNILIYISVDTTAAF